MLETVFSNHPLVPVVMGCIGLVLVAFLADWLAKRVMLAAVTRLARSTRLDWDDALVGSKVFHRLAMVVPALVLYAGIPVVPSVPVGTESVVRNVSSAWMIMSFMLALAATLTAFNTLYEKRPEAKERPIKGFIQLAEIGVYLVGGILIIAALIDRSADRNLLFRQRYELGQLRGDAV
jgi:miniconductance mechanosensitive channel